MSAEEVVLRHQSLDLAEERAGLLHGAGQDVKRLLIGGGTSTLLANPDCQRAAGAGEEEQTSADAEHLLVDPRRPALVFDRAQWRLRPLHQRGQLGGSSEEAHETLCRRDTDANELYRAARGSGVGLDGGLDIDVLP